MSRCTVGKLAATHFRKLNDSRALPADVAEHVQESDTSEMAQLRQDMLALMTSFHERTQNLERTVQRQNVALQVQHPVPDGPAAL